MASNTAGLTMKPSYFDKPYAVSGYTGNKRVKEDPTPADAFPGLPQSGGAPKPMANLLDSFHASKTRHETIDTQAAGFRMPGYAGLTPGHAQVCGRTIGAICRGAAGRTDYAAIGDGAPGTAEKPQIINSVNLQPGAKLPDGQARTKAGYTGYLPGCKYSTNYGVNFNETAGKLLINADTQIPIKIGEFSTAERPTRLQCGVSGYRGFKPRATPGLSAMVGSTPGLR